MSRNKCFFYHRNVPGNNFNSCTDKTDTAKGCHELCNESDRCAQFTWYDKSFGSGQRYKDCCMKNVHNNYYEYAKGAISGIKHCTQDLGKNSSMSDSNYVDNSYKYVNIWKWRNENVILHV